LATFRLKHVSMAEQTVSHDAREVRTKGRKTFTSIFFPVGPEPVAIVADYVAISFSIKKSKMLPFLPAEKSNQAIFWSLAKKDGVFSEVKGESPFHSRPARINLTRRRTTSETGSLALISSRKEGGNRIGSFGTNGGFAPARKGLSSLSPLIHRPKPARTPCPR
jgi:hypothetical protein